jgi:hypothetical protein
MTEKRAQSLWSRKIWIWDQLLGGGLPFEIGGGRMLLIKELTGS